MYFKTKIIALLLTFSLFATVHFAYAKTKVLAGITPGIHYVEQGKEAGPAVDLLKMLFARAELDYEFDISNWAQAHKGFAESPESLMFAVARFPAREPEFIWVVDIGPLDLRIARSKDRADLNPTRLDELKNYKIAVVRSSVSHHLLLDAGFVEDQDFGTVVAADEIIKYMASGFVEFVFYESTITPLMLRLFNYPPDFLVPTKIQLPVSPKLWLVASQDFPEAKLQHIRDTHARLLSDPQYQQLRKAVLPLSHGKQ